jgi:pimeloyl-ACP methyl ester carboxylesterase
MTPLMFGPPARRLFGLYHPAEDGRPDKGAVLICPPFGQEALRSHRFFKVLADRLARAGFSVLRFDYYGTGDSPGDDVEGEFDGWASDIAAAHEELRRLSSAGAPGTPDGPGVRWLGVRLGGTLALLAAQQTRPRLERLVLWEPVVDGRRYTQMLREWHVHSLELSYCIPEPSLRRQLATDPLAFTAEASGFAVSPTLQRQFEQLRPQSLRFDANCGTVVIAQPDDASIAAWAGSQGKQEQEQQQHMGGSTKSSGAAIRISEFAHALDWNSDPSSNNALVPAEALKRLLATMNE